MVSSLHGAAFVRQISLLFIATACLGCSESSGPKTDMIPVSGVAYMDGKPLTAATVMFNPLPGTAGNGGFGVTDAEGKFSLTDYQMNPGCPPGEYGVTFTKITQPDGSPIPPGAQRGEVGMVEQIPLVYNEFRSQAVIQGATVKGPESTFEFRLDSKFRPPANFFAQ